MKESEITRVCLPAQVLQMMRAQEIVTEIRD